MLFEKTRYKYRAFRYRYIIDPSEINYILENLSEGQNALDIGCHKGGYLYWMQKAVTSQGKVIAFEPQPHLYENLIRIVSKFRYNNVVIENKGVSDKNGEVDFYVPIAANASPNARIDKPLHQEYKTIPVKVVSLDEYFPSLKIVPHFIKIDVEGHEKNVIHGAINLLTEFKPKILMECEQRHLPQGNIFDVFRTLTDLDYKGYFFLDKNLVPLAEFNPIEHQSEMAFTAGKGYINNFVFE